MLEYMRFWWEILGEHSEGNPAMQLQADHVTINRTKFLSIGHIGVCPRTFTAFCIASGFPMVKSKTDEESVEKIETAAVGAFKAMALEVAHSCVTDGGARSMGPALEKGTRLVDHEPVQRYSAFVTCPVDICMMHDLSKVSCIPPVRLSSSPLFEITTLTLRYPFVSVVGSELRYGHLRLQGW